MSNRLSIARDDYVASSNGLGTVKYIGYGLPNATKTPERSNAQRLSKARPKWLEASRVEPNTRSVAGDINQRKSVKSKRGHARMRIRYSLRK